MGEVNRALTDPALDDVDHALGRPVKPFGGYRNHFDARGDDDRIAAMRGSPWWQEGGATRTVGGVFHVTMEGRRALAEHLSNIGFPELGWRIYLHGNDGLGPDAVVIARSRSAAKYNYFLSCDGYYRTFRDALNAIRTVRLT